MRPLNRRLLFLLFFLSGFCGLLYQVVWTRLAFASFGIITPVLSVSVSVFMLGLALGSWAGGRWIASLVGKTGWSAASFYALAELLIGLGAVVVPKLFGLSEHVLLALGEADSARYLFYSAVALAISILPWCVLLGATFPLMMAYVRERDPRNWESFSYLYLANVLGAVLGTLLTGFVLIELLGFRHTLWVAAVGNFSIAAIAGWLGNASRQPRGSAPSAPAKVEGPGETVPAVNDKATWRSTRRLILPILFTTGFASMGMEVVWTRAFTPVVKTQVYSFALVVAAYLAATALGSFFYRRHLRRDIRARVGELIALLCAAALLPILLNDPRWVKANWLYTSDPLSVCVVLASIWPFCGLLGYLTPRLVDEFAGGAPAEAGKAYAYNVLGCIVGPLFAGYILLPLINERFALLLLAAPLFVLFLVSTVELPRDRRFALGAGALVVLLYAAFLSRSYEEQVLRSEKHIVERRDYAASVLAYGEDFHKLLCVNGIGMTTLTPMTKFMVHLPLAYHRGKPKSILIICFGMGTSYRAALSWGIKTTAVELVPSVVKTFGFFHADAARSLDDPNGHIVVDDGRRFLKRTDEKFDVIIIDPPPPMEAAGSSLLYSREFYELAKMRLMPDGILQAWYPGTEDERAARAMFRSLHEAFPYVFCADGVDGWGTHFLASMSPIEPLNGAQLAARMPAAAQQDLLQWTSITNAGAYLDAVVSKGVPIDRLLDSRFPLKITDDHPYNEYFFLQKLDML